MRFKVRRTSDPTQWDRDHAPPPPCAEATEGTIELWDFRTCKTPEEFTARGLGDWFGEGTSEHGTYVTGQEWGIKRRRHPDCPAWFVEIASLEALEAFAEKYGDLILTTAIEDGKTPQIEIYDTWRE